MRTQGSLLSWPLFLQVPSSASIWGPMGITLMSPLASPQNHSIQKCQSSGMAVTIHVDKGWEGGVASRDGDKDLRESDDVRAMGFCQLWAESLFLYRWGTLLCWQRSGDQSLP